METYNLTNSVSVVAAPIASQDKSVSEQEEQKIWVAKEVVRLNNQHEDTVRTLQEYKKRNEEQCRTIVLYNQWRLGRPQLPTISLPDRPTTAQRNTLLDQPTTAIEQAPTQQETMNCLLKGTFGTLPKLSRRTWNI